VLLPEIVLDLEANGASVTGGTNKISPGNQSGALDQTHWLTLVAGATPLQRPLPIRRCRLRNHRRRCIKQNAG
jgi:hypothetical protein